jgi:hypothetical protein
MFIQIPKQLVQLSMCNAMKKNQKRISFGQLIFVFVLSMPCLHLQMLSDKQLKIASEKSKVPPKTRTVPDQWNAVKALSK